MPFQIFHKAFFQYAICVTEIEKEICLNRTIQIINLNFWQFKSLHCIKIKKKKKTKVENDFTAVFLGWVI